MEQKGELVSFRPDIKVVDCTLRDGGLVNNFEFSEDFVRDLYKANVAAGVDYMEFGYKADKDIFDEKEFCDGFINLDIRHQRKSLRLRITASGSSAMRKI